MAIKLTEEDFILENGIYNYKNKGVFCLGDLIIQDGLKTVYFTHLDIKGSIITRDTGIIVRDHIKAEGNISALSLRARHYIDCGGAIVCFSGGPGVESGYYVRAKKRIECCRLIAGTSIISGGDIWVLGKIISNEYIECQGLLYSSEEIRAGSYIEVGRDLWCKNIVIADDNIKVKEKIECSGPVISIFGTVNASQI